MGTRMKTMSRKTVALFGTCALIGWLLIGCSANSPFILPNPNGASNNDLIIDTSQAQESQFTYLARLHTELATGYYTRKQYQVALEEVGEALKANPKYAPA